MTAEFAAEPEVFVSVDIEASAQSPGVGSLLSIGACLVYRPEIGIYLELKPLPDRAWDPHAEKIHGLARQRLEDEGLEPAPAMKEFERWVGQTCGAARPIFVGFNAPFDWMFVADYFWRYIGRNPFGISAVDLKSLYMARADVSTWEETRRVYVDERLGLAPDHTHHALEDARGQAALARLLLRRTLDEGSEG